MVHIVSSENEIDNILKTTKGLVVVDVFATWCGPCKALSPKLDKMESEYKNVVFLKVDVDEVPAFADNHGVSAMPTILFMKDGWELERVAGANEPAIRNAINKHM